jgi:hypothetical protein
VRFERGNQNGGGRPKGSRNALDAFAYATALAHVQHNSRDPAPVEYADSNLWKALEATLRRDPREYLHRVISMLPKQVAFEHTSTREMAEGDLDDLIEAMRQRLLEAREERALEQAAQIKLVSHVQ